MRKLFQTQCPAMACLIFVCLSTLFLSCSDRVQGSPSGYDMKNPAKRGLGKVLNEISGIYFSAEDKTLLAIADSKRKIYQLDLRHEKLKDVAEKFYTQSDFEDLVKLDTTVYVLVSDGTILAVPMHVKDSTRTVVYPFIQNKKNDFESLYYDPSLKSLVILCKDCEDDEGKRQRSAYRFDLSTNKFDSSALYTISTEAVKAAVKNDDADFKPSAAAIHPITKELYILASAGQLLVITDTKGQVQHAYGLNPDTHPQAEGITFAPNGTMYISNEGKYGKPTLQVFPYKGKSAAGKTK